MDRDVEKAVEACKGKSIAGGFIDDNRLNLVFTDRTVLEVWDGARYCCEYRHMTCDDDLASFMGAVFEGMEVRDVARSEEDSYDAHDMQFVRILTTLGDITLCNHNNHNGYYGGFEVAARVEVVKGA